MLGTGAGIATGFAGRTKSTPQAVVVHTAERLFLSPYANPGTGGDVMPALPRRPSLEHLRHEARNLLRAAKAGDPDAIERIRVASSDRITLSVAQLAIARKYGWRDWPVLRRHVEEQNRLEDLVDSPTGLDLLDEQARHLLHTAKAGDAQAINRLRSVSDLWGAGAMTLSVARDVIAQEYAHAPWQFMSGYVEVHRRARERADSTGSPGSVKLSCDQMAAEVEDSGPDRYEAAASAGLERWVDFPVLAEPRPLVLTGRAVRIGGFVDSASKRAYTAGAIEGAPGVPDEPLQLVRRALRRHSGVVATSTLLLTRADRADGEFWTDRGRQLLPAWRIESPNAREDMWAMDEATLARCWSPPPKSAEGSTRPIGPVSVQRAVLSGDGVTLRVRFTGGSESIITYDGFVSETSTAVCVIPVARQLEALPPRTALHMAEYTRQLTVRLACPLGARVLIRLDASPVVVLSEAVP